MLFKFEMQQGRNISFALVAFEQNVVILLLVFSHTSVISNNES